MLEATYSTLDPKNLDNFTNPLRVPGEEGIMGVLDAAEAPARLVARREDVEVLPGGKTGMLVYRAERNGKVYTNPTFRVRRGDRFSVEFLNELDADTTIHWHGLGVPWEMDGHPLKHVYPGSAYRYEFPVPDAAATYWYHPHAHGSTARQTYYGLSGLLLVEDENEDGLRDALDLEFGRTEIPLVIQDRLFDEGGGLDYEPEEMDRFMGITGDAILVNLTPTPRLEVSARTYRFRILNGSNARAYRLAFSASGGGEPLPSTLIGTDAGLLEKPRGVSELFLSPGERADVLLDLGSLGVGEVVALKSLRFDPMHNEHGMEEGADHHVGPARLGDGDEFHVLRLDVTGTARGKSRTTLPEVLSAPRPVDAGAPTRVITLSADMGEESAEGGAREYTCPMHPEVVRDEPGSCSICGMELVAREGAGQMRWLINGLTYELDEYPVVVREGAAEVWEFRNDEKSMPHPMHVHGFDFQVLERSGSPEQVGRLAIDGLGRTATDLGVKDTVTVWPGETVRISLDFSHGHDGEQLYLFHCHVLEHEDTGMMLNFKVISGEV